MLTVLPILFAIIAIVTLVTTTLVACQRAWTRLAMVRQDLREGGPFITVRYSVTAPAWPQPVTTQAVRQAKTARTGQSRVAGRGAIHDRKAA
ncbi:MAG: hypothetical protein ACKOPO_06815 [Novosphingobium sp.]